MERTLNNSKNDKYVDFVSPANTNQRIFLGKKLKISTEANKVLANLPSHEKLKLHNNINKLVADITNYRLNNNKHIYFKLSNSYLKLSVESSNPPYIGTISRAKIITKPQPLRPKAADRSNPLNCGIRTLRGLAKELVNTPYQFEKVVNPNVFNAEQLVDIQVKRVRKRLKELKLTKPTDYENVGHTNPQWAEVIYGAEPFFLGLGTGDEMITLSGIYGVSEQTQLLSKTYFGSTKQSGITKVLHNYAVIIGYPDYDQNVPEKNIQLVVSETNLNSKKAIKSICGANYKYGSDVIIKIDSELNLHKFFRNGEYQFVKCL